MESGRSILHEYTVYLDDIHGQILQVTVAGHATAESVERKAALHLLDAVGNQVAALHSIGETAGDVQDIGIAGIECLGAVMINMRRSCMTSPDAAAMAVIP